MDMKSKNARILPIILLLIVSLTVMGISGWLWYDTTVDRSGWAEREGIRYYRDFYGDPLSGWLTLEDQTYHLSPEGIPETGWQTIEQSRYYFRENGTLATGWQVLEDGTYYFGSDGAMRSGWLELDEARYYLDNGRLVTGWQDIDGKRRFFGTDGAIPTGFTKIGNEIYYFHSDGTFLTGDANIGGLEYFFYEDGVLHTGWRITDAGRRYYFIDGSMALSWQQLDGKYYCFDDSGFARIGWYTEGEYNYYFLEDGSAATGPTVVDGLTHYFTPKGIEVILVNRDNPVPSYYHRELVTVTGWHQVDSRCYNSLMQMLNDCNAAGISYTFNSGYRTIAEQTLILETRTQEHMENYDLDYDEARKKALQTVAIPGTSEHHLGLAVDLLGSEAIAWFSEHCWDYGFIIRYTEEKEPITGIIDEPWHFRYVGTEVSLDMKNSGLCLEEYLGAA